MQGRIGWLDDQDYKRYLLSIQIKKFNTTIDDINAGGAIYGPPVTIV